MAREKVLTDKDHVQLREKAKFLSKTDNLLIHLLKYADETECNLVCSWNNATVPVCKGLFDL